MQTEDYCPATICIKVADKKKAAFAGTEGDIELVGVNSCGGCPGKKAALRARETARAAGCIVDDAYIPEGHEITVDD